MVDYGQASGHDVFNGLLISLFEVVLIKHHSKNIVEQTARIPLFEVARQTSVDPQQRSAVFGENDSTPADSDSDEEAENGSDIVEQPGSSLEQTNLRFTAALASYSKGFNAMIHLFDAAVKQSLKPSPRNTASFPIEVCHMILEHVDDDTYRTCSQVSRIFCDYTQKNIRLGGHVVRRCQPPFMFRIFDTVLGAEIESSIQATARCRRSDPVWLPVFGVNRPSIFSSIDLVFEGLSAPLVLANGSQSATSRNSTDIESRRQWPSPGKYYEIHIHGCLRHRENWK